MTQLADQAREAFWRELIARFDPRLRAYCRTLRCSEDDIEDILWDIWQEATASKPTLATSNDQWPILHLLARRICATRARWWRRECPLDDNDHVTASIDPGELLDSQQELRVWADQILGRLPEKQRLAIEYRCRWGWPYWAVAAALDSAEPTARVHVARGLRHLRTLTQQSPPPNSYRSTCGV